MLESRRVEAGNRTLQFKDFILDGYDLICAINFEASIESLQKQIENLKNIYEMLNASELGLEEKELPDLALEVERRNIEQRPKVSFDYEAYEPRAVGLWLWDHVHEQSGATVPRGAITKAVREFRSKFDLGALGYALSEMSVFQKLYRNTGRCIEKAEVLSLG